MGRGLGRADSHATNIRAHHADLLHQGVPSPYSSVAGGQSRTPGPPRRGRNTTKGTSKYLKTVVSDAVQRTHGAPSGISYKSTKPPGAKASRPHKQRGADVLDPDEMVHEIFQLKKEILAWQTQHKVLQTTLHSREKDIKQLHETLKVVQGDQDRGTGNVDVSHSRLIAGLKRSVQQLRKDVLDRDERLAKLLSDDKRSNVEELQLEVSIYYEEVLRLQSLLDAGGGQSARQTDAADYHVAPSVATMRKLKENCRVLEAANLELKRDFEDAAAKLYSFEDERKQFEAPGGEGKYAQLDRDGAVQQLIKKDRANATLRTELEGHRNAQESILKEHGLESLDELKKLKAKLRDLTDENAVLRRERDTAHSITEQTKEDMAHFSTNLTRRLSVAMDENQSALSGNLTERLAAAMEENKKMLSGKMDESQRNISGTLQDRLDLVVKENKQLLDGTAARYESTIKANEQVLSENGQRYQAVVKSNEKVLGDTLTKYQNAMKENEHMLEGKLSKLDIPKVSGTASMVGHTSGAGAMIEADILLEQKRKRASMLETNKPVIDHEVTKVQSVLRGHIARQRLRKRLDRMPAAKPPPHASGGASAAGAATKSGTRAGAVTSSSAEVAAPVELRKTRNSAASTQNATYFRAPQTRSGEDNLTASSLSGGARYSEEESLVHSDPSIMSDDSDDLW